MMGRLEADQERLFYNFRLEDQVPANHLLRKLDALLDFDMVRKQLEPFYSEIGRPSVDPELMIRMLLIGYAEARIAELTKVHDTMRGDGARVD